MRLNVLVVNINFAKHKIETVNWERKIKTDNIKILNIHCVDNIYVQRLGLFPFSTESNKKIRNKRQRIEPFHSVSPLIYWAESVGDSVAWQESRVVTISRESSRLSLSILTLDSGGVLSSKSWSYDSSQILSELRLEGVLEGAKYRGIRDLNQFNVKASKWSHTIL